MNAALPQPLTLAWLNAAPPADALAALDGLYEHSPWVMQAALARQPAGGFASLAQLKHALASAVREADADAQLALVRAHPELAGKAALAGTLTVESTGEQARAGLGQCTPQELARVQQLNADYNARFGWPFVMAVRGARGLGLHRSQIIATVERRLRNPPDYELQECLRQIDRIAEIRLNDKFGAVPLQGQQVWDACEALAAHSDPGFKERGELTVTYLTAAHQACAAQIAQDMRDSGFDDVQIDAVGNVVGVFHGADAEAPRLLTGSHYDTVRNGGKYDGRLGIFVPLACVRAMHAAGRRLPFGIEVVGFAEEEGQRYKATFLGSSALTGQFDPAWLDEADADGTTMRDAMQAAGHPATMASIAPLQRDPARYLGFVEVHIEQGPVLNELNLPLGVVSSINGSRRFLGTALGMASHAGTTPMNRRRDAACAVAELALYAEARAAADGDSVATVGMLNVPSGSINVVPGRCDFSLDLRAPTDAQRDRLWDDIAAQVAAIAARRGVQIALTPTMAASAAPSAPAWQHRWEAAVQSLGLPVHRMPSGAGHDAMKLHELMPQAMLFVRGENAGISHNPLESTTADDMQLAVDAFTHLLDSLAQELRRRPPMTHISAAQASALDDWIDAHFDEQVRFLQALVQVPTDTPPGRNAPHAERTAELLSAFGFEAEKFPIPATDVKASGLESITNLIVRRRYGAGGKVIALNAHGDVVPPGEGWTHDPYGGEIEDGKLYGRAAAVSKCDFSTFTFAVRALEALQAPLRGGVELHFTYDEEFGGELGPGWLLQQGLTKPDLAIAAGFSYQIVTAHNGCLQMEVTVHGEMAHAAIPESGIDALHGAVAVLNALYHQNTLYRSITSQVPGISHPYLNIGLIEGGTNTNVVPGKVTFKLDRRMIPEEVPDDVEADIRRVIADAVAAFAATHPGFRVDIRRMLMAHPLKPLPGNQPLVDALQHHAQAVFGQPIATTGTPLYTDVRLYCECGIPAVIYGAGPRTVRESNAKRADEHIVLDDLRRATKVVARALLELLG